jgi:hypothetical protein
MEVTMELIDVLAYGSLKIKLLDDGNWHTVDIVTVKDRNITVKLPTLLKHFSISSEIHCMFGDGKNSYLFSGEIFDVVFRQPQSLVIYVPGKIKRFNEFRREKRYITRFLGEVYKLKRQLACVKDVSSSGVCLYTDAHLETGDVVGVKFFYKEDVKDFIYFIGLVMWKKKLTSTVAYGIEIDQIDNVYEDKYFELIQILNSK